MSWSRYLIAAILATIELATLPACRHAEALSLDPKQPVAPNDYQSVLERWTRSDEVYDGLESKMFVHATLFGPQFLRAFEDHFGAVFGPIPHESGLPTAASENRRPSFVFSVATSSPPWNDFEHKNSIWRVTLETDGGAATAGQVVRLHITANHRVVFPYITDWSKVYVVRFPPLDAEGHPTVAENSKKLTLRMISGLGQAKMEWKLQPMLGSNAPVLMPAATSTVIL